MNKISAIRAAQFVKVLLTCNKITFGAVRKLRTALEQFEKVEQEYEELKKIETEDKEEGLAKFLDEPFEFEPIPAELFDKVEAINTGAYLNNDLNKELNFVEVVQILEVYEVIK